MIDTAVGGMVTRFTHQGKLPTVLAVASSKRSEQSFMEEYIKALSANDPEHTLVVDKPVWEIKPKETYLLPGQTEVETFYVALGNKFLESVVVPEIDETEQKLSEYREKGYKLLKVPRFFKAKFLEDLERNLCDIAGISSSSANKYMSASAVKECIIEDFKNPFPDILTIGNAPDDVAQYQNFFNLENVPQELLSKPLCLHLDMSISGDMTGIAGVWIIGKKPSTQEGEEGKDLQFRLAFSTSIQAPKGRQVSFEKNRIFIRWLKSIGFNIKEITTDTFQSYDLRQILAQEGFNCSILSVDRCDSDRVCKPYQFLKNAVYEKRFFMFNSKRLFDEFVDVERNINTGKIDHTQNYHKDALDAVCGATYTCAKYAQEYAYDYGETYEIVTSANIPGQASSAFQQQITVDFEQELKKVFGDFGLKNTENNCINNQIDNSLMYLEQGIIVL